MNTPTSLRIEIIDETNRKVTTVFESHKKKIYADTTTILYATDIMPYPLDLETIHSVRKHLEKIENFLLADYRDQIRREENEMG